MQMTLPRNIYFSHCYLPLCYLCFVRSDCILCHILIEAFEDEKIVIKEIKIRYTGCNNSDIEYSIDTILKECLQCINKK